MTEPQSPFTTRADWIPVSLPKGTDPEVIDERADEVTAGLDDSERERVQQAVAGDERVVRGSGSAAGSGWRPGGALGIAVPRNAQVHLGVPGKGMIVCATRQICADVYERIIALRPDWHRDDIRKGKIKVLYTRRAWRCRGDPEACPSAVSEQGRPGPGQERRR